LNRTSSRAGANNDTTNQAAIDAGHLNAGQFEEAYDLAQGCMRVWPTESRLTLMSAYAAVELLEPLDDETLAILHEAECQDWATLILRRAENHDDADATTPYLQ
jgi:hypothetical protein